MRSVFQEDEPRQLPIQETDKDALQSKQSTINQGYLTDPFTSMFIKRPINRASPIIHRGTYIRCQAIDKLITSFVARYSGSQVVSLGAGSDSRFFWLKSNKKLDGCVYFEIDFKDVVKAKQNTIKRNSQLLQLLSNVTVNNDCLKSTDYVLFPGDLRNFDQTIESLKNNGFNETLPTFILSEMVLVYLDPSIGDSYISWFSKLAVSMFLTYEPILPFDAFGKVMMTNFARFPLLSINAFPTLEVQESRYKNGGYSVVKARDLVTVYDEFIDDQEKKRISKLEWLDELEEFNLLLGHYCLVVGENTEN